MGKLTLSAIALGCLLAPPAAGQSSLQRDNAPQTASQFAPAMSAAMDKMHRDMAAPTLTGDPDRDFLELMIPHHAGAVEMARLLLIQAETHSFASLPRRSSLASRRK